MRVVGECPKMNSLAHKLQSLVDEHAQAMPDVSSRAQKRARCDLSQRVSQRDVKDTLDREAGGGVGRVTDSPRASQFVRWLFFFIFFSFLSGA